MKTTTVGTLMRELNDFDPRTRLYLDGGKLMIGKTHCIPLPSKLEREIAHMHEDNNGVREDK